MEEQKHACLHCLHDAVLVVRWDKKSRPYTRCLCCGTLSFLHSELALAGLFLFAKNPLRQVKQALGYEPGDFANEASALYSGGAAAKESAGG